MVGFNGIQPLKSLSTVIFLFSHLYQCFVDVIVFNQNGFFPLLIFAEEHINMHYYLSAFPPPYSFFSHLNEVLS